MPPIICPIVRWTARGTAFLIAAGFLAFVIGEPVGSLRVIQFREWLGKVLLFAAVAGMLLAWKWEFPAALISLFALAAFAVVVHMQRYDVLAIAAIPNILFLLDWKLRRSHSTRISTVG
jgi:ABC-type antimicrobial peptide transport system permease subunit